jgi:hypothetical protein
MVASGSNGDTIFFMLSRRQQSGYAVASAVRLRLAERLRGQSLDAFGSRRDIRLLAAPEPCHCRF